MVEPIPTLNEWKNQTTLGVFSSRDKALVAIDKQLEKYHQATSDYGRKWEETELRTVFEAWKKQVGACWEKHERNVKGSFTRLDHSLPSEQKSGIAVSTSGEQTTENMRKGTLYFLSNVSTNSGIPSNLMDWAKDTAGVGADIKELISVAQPENVGKLANQIKEGGFINADCGVEPPDENGFMSQIIASVKSLLSGLLNEFPGDAARKAAEWISDHTPELVAEILGAVADHLRAALGIGKNMIKAVQAVKDFYKTRHLEEGILSGQPSLVIDSIREQIKGCAYEGLKQAVVGALMLGLDCANPAIASIVSAIKNLFAFIIRAFMHFREVYKVNKVIEGSKQLYEEKLYEKADEFNNWYLEVIEDLPIVSCYCLAMPMSGSFYGFLAMVSRVGQSLTQTQLQQNHDLFEDLKGKAKEFVGVHSVKLISTDAIVNLSLDVAKGRKITVKEDVVEDKK